MSRLDTMLDSFSQKISPAPADIREAETIASKIFRILQKNKKYSIDRYSIMGSVEKDTALASEFDMDLVIYVNNITVKDFPNVYNYFETTLELEESISGIVFQTQTDPLQATVNGFEFDIAVAINFSRQSETQRRMVWEKLRNLKYPSKEGFRYSSSLVMDQVEFIKSQRPFTHKLIRLAKYWNRMIFIDKFIAGRSVLIELVALQAAREEDSFEPKSLLRAFQRFLEKMRNLRNLCIIFDSFYSKHEIPQNILGQRPLVMDPCNPYRNYAYDLFLAPKVLDMFVSCAKYSIEKLSRSYDGTCELWEIFAVQPRNPPEEFLTIKKGSWLVGVTANENDSARIRIVERNDQINHNAIKIMKHYLCFNIRFLESSASKTREEIQEDVKNYINEIEGAGKRNWVGSDEKHSDYDVTFEIPCGSNMIHCSKNF